MKIHNRDEWIERHIVEYFGYLEAMEQAVLRALLANCWEQGCRCARQEMLDMLRESEEITLESNHHDH